ncbi:serine protease [Hoyosella rhizosphaerae]|uniref:Serine protease n=2 Tax=Hoyosella rhizosphaerae TaxID=1755582 RepID=A0A916UB25_9ACTN|nr:serine protease [Hoyosella rhizosphaerae]
MTFPKQFSSKLPAVLGGDHGGVVAAVRIQGMIAPHGGGIGRHVVTAESVDEQLVRAFTTDHVKAVALVINSPGGSPMQSEAIASRVRGLATKHKVPVLAFCEDVTASGGYWVACAADEIYAAATSMVGSIGVISSGFGFVDLMNRVGVERRVYTSGTEKARLDPFLPEQSEDVEWLSGLQSSMHELFRDWVTERRGAKLDTTNDLFNGDVWLGAQAHKLGLVDGVGGVRTVIDERFPGAEIEFVTPKRPLFARLGMPFPDPFGMDGVVSRLAWARFGL